MTLWQDPPPQTRRQARESERAAALQAENAGRSRRAGTVAPTAAGDIPEVSTPFGANTPREATDTSAGQDGDSLGHAPSARPVPPRYEGVSFDTLVKPQKTASDLYRPAGASDRPEPVTQPVSLLTPPPVAAPEVTAPESEDPTSGRALTRRELRALLQAQQASDQGQPAGDQPAVTPEQTQVPTVTAAPVAAKSFADVLAPTSDDAGSTETAQPRPYQPPTGHWSIAAQEPDEAAEAEQASGYARSRVSSGTVTSSNALILPTVPSIADATGPLTSTGEILVTGSIDLPRSLGSTGTHSDRFDSSDIDRLFEQSEGEQNTSDVAPIRASRAVSTHTSTRDTITPRKHPGNKLPTVLAITAGVLLVGVVGLLFAAFVFKVF